MFDYLVNALLLIAGCGMFCMVVIGFVKILDIFLNTFDDRDPWK